MRKPRLVATLAGGTLLVIVLAIVASTMFLSRAITHASGVGDSGRQLTFNNARPVTTINGLNRITVIGSTAFIVDNHGHTISVDPNPYGIAIAPRAETNSRLAGSLRPGDVIVTNFGANDTGVTLVRFPGGHGPGLLFNTTPNPGTKGPAFEAFNTLTGTAWVPNFSANDVQVFQPNGAVLVTITNALFNKPWGGAFNNGVHNPLDGSVGSFFVANSANATIDRIDIIPTSRGPVFRVFQIAQLTMTGNQTRIDLVWVPVLQIGGRLFADVLLALDPAHNRIAAFPHSTTLNTTTTMRSTGQGITVFQGKPLNMPGGIAINPLNGDILVTNLNDNNLVEINATSGRVIGIRLLDNVPVDLQSGNGSALFGVAATTDNRGNLVVFFVDDNYNTLNVLTAS